MPGECCGSMCGCKCCDCDKGEARPEGGFRSWAWRSRRRMFSWRNWSQDWMSSSAAGTDAMELSTELSTLGMGPAAESRLRTGLCARVGLKELGPQGAAPLGAAADCGSCSLASAKTLPALVKVSCKAAAPADKPSSTRPMSILSLSSVISVRSLMVVAPAQRLSSMRPIRPRMVFSSSVEKLDSWISRSFFSLMRHSSRRSIRASRLLRECRSAASSPSRRATRARRPESLAAPPTPPAPSAHSSRRR
mmetsp:Transcript_101223/g.216785  ORF Transcript_101223/g.216785 Transcript_101223/m.216785 type:complete len:249 (-) Transcript_101223:21-767(-)